MIRGIKNGIDGIVTIATSLPQQVVRFVSITPKQLYLGDDNMESYYFGNPQLFKMPKAYQHSTALDAFTEDSVTKALPYIVGGIAAIVAYNIFFKK